MCHDVAGNVLIHYYVFCLTTLLMTQVAVNVLIHYSVFCLTVSLLHDITATCVMIVVKQNTE